VQHKGAPVAQQMRDVGPQRLTLATRNETPFAVDNRDPPNIARLQRQPQGASSHGWRDYSGASRLSRKEASANLIC
jgi:hypothetical protein